MRAAGGRSRTPSPEMPGEGRRRYAHDKSQSIKDLRMLTEAEGVLNLKNILKAKRAGLHRSVRMPVFSEGEVESWVFSHEAAGRKPISVDQLVSELNESPWNERIRSNGTGEKSVGDSPVLDARNDSVAAGAKPVEQIQEAPQLGAKEVTWYHMFGSDEDALLKVAQHFHLDFQDVHAACTPAMNGPEVKFVKGSTREKDYLFLICHELRLAYGDGSPPSEERFDVPVKPPPQSESEGTSNRPQKRFLGVKNRAGHDRRDPIWAASRQLELEEVQVCFFFFPDQQVVISVGLSSRQSPVLCAARDNLANVRSALRKDCLKGQGGVALICVMLDALMDTILPTLDLYGDVLEGIGLLMNASPDHTFVRLSTKLKTRLHQIRRYTWDARGIFLELQQDMYGVMGNTGHTQTLINSTNQIEKETEAYLQACTDIDSFYNSFQQSKMNSTLYTLTTATISIMPMQLMTGIWGMNFTTMKELEWEHGYLMFWILSSCVLLCAVVYVSRAHLIARRGTLILHSD